MCFDVVKKVNTAITCCWAHGYLPSYRASLPFGQFKLSFLFRPCKGM